MEAPQYDAFGVAAVIGYAVLSALNLAAVTLVSVREPA
jgi:hypothetical protein